MSGYYCEAVGIANIEQGMMIAEVAGTRHSFSLDILRFCFRHEGTKTQSFTKVFIVHLSS